MQKDIVRVCTINVGTMKGRSREVVEMMARRRVDICCVQETQYKGEKDKRGGVGILIKEELAKEIVEVKKNNH